MNKINNPIKFTAIVTVEGLSVFEKAQFDTKDPRLDGAPGTVALEIHADAQTASLFERDVCRALRRRGPAKAMAVMDEYIIPWRVLIAKVTTGDAFKDTFIKAVSEIEGYDANVVGS